MRSLPIDHKDTTKNREFALRVELITFITNINEKTLYYLLVEGLLNTHF